MKTGHTVFPILHYALITSQHSTLKTPSSVTTEGSAKMIKIIE